MKRIFKRVELTAFVVLIFVYFNLASCDLSGGQSLIADNFEVFDGFSVNFLDVGEGDAIFINFGDGKTMLIDCGEKTAKNIKTVGRYIDAYGGKLDYFVLTHPDEDHVGNAAEILDKYEVGVAYIPDIFGTENFSAYYNAYLKIAEKGIGVISATGNIIYGENYYAVFLSPNAKGTTDSAYSTFNSYSNPPADVINDVSPIIYLEYRGVRFVFTGDAGFSQEKVALYNVKIGLIKKYLKSIDRSDVLLSGVDFLKVSHHGAADGSGADFLQKLTPKNAVVSVGGDNYFGHPAQTTLTRIKAANYDCKIYLTSEFGTISVRVDGKGDTTVKTDLKAA